jgi:hypothetical protein
MVHEAIKLNTLGQELGRFAGAGPLGSPLPTMEGVERLARPRETGYGRRVAPQGTSALLEMEK